MTYDSYNAFDDQWFKDQQISPEDVAKFIDHELNGFQLVQRYGDDYDWELLGPAVDEYKD